jgi:hypothetical protein
MPITPPNLDDRNFADLVADARSFISSRCPDWNDLTESDPGMVLVELFAYLTDTMLYRLNRVPVKAYCEFLRLIGVRLYPPAAATAMLRFTRSRPGDGPIEIPRGTRVTVARADPQEGPMFVTTASVTIGMGATEAEVEAVDCELVEGELVGAGTGAPGLSVVLRRPPVIAPTPDGLDLVLGVEASRDELERVPARRFGGKTFRIWQETESFARSGPSDTVFVADRVEGTVTFGPAVRLNTGDGHLAGEPQSLGASPGAGRELRVWYRRGGGPLGNVGAGTLTVMKDPVVGVEVTNPEPATGGRAAETIDNALLRGPRELHSLNRALTADDFERIAEQLGGVARARALTRAELWSFARPGTVEVVIVPDLPAAARPEGRVTADAMREHQTEEARARVQAVLDERRPLGTACLVSWASYKTVTVKLKLHVLRQEDADSVRARVLADLHSFVNPLPPPDGSRPELGGMGRLSASGWRFGQPLRVSDVYHIAQREPGVLWVERPSAVVDEMPDQDVASVAADWFQPGMWYAGAQSIVFSSRNDGEGWEPVGRFPQETVLVVSPSPDEPGVVAVATEVADGGGFRVHISDDCGQSWHGVALLDARSRIHDLACTRREGSTLLLMATDTGLYELAWGGTPLEVLVDLRGAGRPMYAVAAAVVRGTPCVAVAAQDSGGVYISKEGGASRTFQPKGCRSDIRVLAVQREGARGFLWAGVTVMGVSDPGRGCLTWELGPDDPQEGWVEHAKGWAAGSVHGLAFMGGAAFAASHRGGVTRLDSRSAEAAWEQPDVNCGLPMRDPGRFQPVQTVAVSAPGTVLMSGGPKGLARSRDGQSYEAASTREFVVGQGEVTTPPYWLLCSGDHQVEVVSDEPR